MGMLGKKIKAMEKARAEERKGSKGGIPQDPNKGCPMCRKSFKNVDEVSRLKHLDRCSGV